MTDEAKPLTMEQFDNLTLAEVAAYWPEVRATVEALERVTRERDEAREQLDLHKRLLLPTAERDGHIYYGPECILCGHFGPTDEPEPCDAEKRFALLKRERDEWKSVNAANARERDAALRERDAHHREEVIQRQRAEKAEAERDALKAALREVTALTGELTPDVWSRLSDVQGYIRHGGALPGAERQRERCANLDGWAESTRQRILATPPVTEGGE